MHLLCLFQVRLKGKTALITGASRGIGRAVALAYAAEGADIAIAGVSDQSALDGVAQEIMATGQRVIAQCTDVSMRNQVDELIARICVEWGGIDILVNNAGIIHMVPLEDISEDQFDRTIAVHLKGTFNCTQSTIPAMKTQGGGKIINVAAPSALRGSTGVADYATAKGGIISFTYNAAAELEEHNIQVNCISPVARTRMTDALIEYRRKRPKEPTSKLTRGEIIEPEAVAPSFVFLASSESDLITGQVIKLHR